MLSCLKIALNFVDSVRRSFKIYVHFSSALFLHLAHDLELYQVTSRLLLIGSYLVLNHANLEICKTLGFHILRALCCLYRLFIQRHCLNGVPFLQHLLSFLKQATGQVAYFPRAFRDSIYILAFLKASLNKPQLLNFRI